METQRDMLAYSTRLIGAKDTQSWWTDNEDVFTHPHFTQLFVPDHANFERLSKHLFGCDDTVWAHTHPDWKRSFGVYIVRRGKEIIYQGRNENRVALHLGLRAKL